MLLTQTQCHSLATCPSKQRRQSLTKNYTYRSKFRPIFRESTWTDKSNRARCESRNANCFAGTSSVADNHPFLFLVKAWEDALAKWEARTHSLSYKQTKDETGALAGAGEGASHTKAHAKRPTPTKVSRAMQQNWGRHDVIDIALSLEESLKSAGMQDRPCRAAAWRRIK